MCQERLPASLTSLPALSSLNSELAIRSPRALIFTVKGDVLSPSFIGSIALLDPNLVPAPFSFYVDAILKLVNVV